MSEATVLFHQGFSDIINHLSILSYYIPTFAKLNVIIRDDASLILESYFHNCDKINLIKIKKSLIDSIFSNYDSMKLFLELNGFDKTYLLFFGFFDRFRQDEYKNKFGLTMHSGIFFVESFYKAYDIPYMNRIDSFHYDRSSHEIQTIESNIFNEFCLKHSIDSTKPFDYVLYHEDVFNKVIINFSNKSTAINLNKMSESFFDCLKILENAKELHLIDSSWACILYLFDAKYNLLKDKPVYLYAKRGYIDMFRYPKPLLNWNLISKF
jgi:hypothetical protein